MAFTSKPTFIPEWATDDVYNAETETYNVATPDAAKIELGWDAYEKPPRNYMNWLQRGNYQWIEYFEQFFGDSHELLVDVIEPNGASGVTIDGVTIKNGAIAADLKVQTGTTATRLYLQTTGSGETGTDGLKIVLNDLGYAQIDVYEAFYLALLTSNVERLRLAASTPQITVANNARDLVDSSGYVVADKIRSTGLIGGVNWTSAQLVGSGLSISGSGNPALCALNGTDVAFIDATLEELRTYQWSGSAWSLVGSGLSISGSGNPALCALNGTDVAFIDAALKELRTYRWSGSAWSLVGSGLSISGSGNPALCALNGTDVAFIDATLEELRTYRWSGSAWSLVGSGLSISGTGTAALCALNGTDVAFIDADLEELRTYRWSGSAWSLVGSGLSISGTSNPALCSLNGTDVAFIDRLLKSLRTYRWSGAAWSLVGSGFSISGMDFPALCALNGTDVAFIDSALDELRTYRFGFSVMGTPPGRGDLLS